MQNKKPKSRRKKSTHTQTHAHKLTTKFYKYLFICLLKNTRARETIENSTAMLLRETEIKKTSSMF